jgi:RNA polymerase sigma-70 factor, ECF subfamily
VDHLKKEVNRIENSNNFYQLNKEQKLELLMDSYGEELKRMVYSYTKNWEMTEDLTQEVFVNVYKNIDTFKGESSIKTWIFRICINKCKDYLRSWHYRKIQLSEFTKEIISEKSPESEYMDVERNEVVSKAVIDLPIKYREIILLYYYKDFSLEEISILMDVNLSTIKSRLRRARMLLEKKLSVLGGNSNG